MKNQIETVVGNNSIPQVLGNAWAIAVAVAFYEQDPHKAAMYWSHLSKLCHITNDILLSINPKHMKCELLELSNEVKAYKEACDKRCIQNLEDAECAKTPPPKGLFPES